MSNIYRLMPRDGSIPYQKIVTGRRWVGRVVRHASEPVYLGIIGKLTVRAPSAGEAFAEVVAQHLGYGSVAAMRARNARVQQATRLANAAADHLMNEYYSGNTEMLYRALDTPAGMTLALRGFTRSLRRK